MYRYFLTARHIGVPVHLGAGYRASVPTTITGSRRFLPTATLAAALVLAAEVTFLTAAGPAGAVAIDHTQANVVSPPAIGHGHELTARQVLLGCRPWHPYR